MSTEAEEKETPQLGASVFYRHSILGDRIFFQLRKKKILCCSNGKFKNKTAGTGYEKASLQNNVLRI